MKIKILGAVPSVALLSFALFATSASPVMAADKETRQMMADIRILQEQSQQLQNLIATLNAALNEAIKSVNARLDDQTNANRKSLADQKLVIDAMANDLRILREKVDDNNVRVGSLGQELDALRQSVAAIANPRPFGLETDSAAASPDSAPAGAAGVGASPQKLLDGARADYYVGQYDLAALGFESYVKTFPQSPQAPDAQLHVGHAYLNSAKYDKAVEAYDAVIRTYPTSSAVPEAYAKKGIALISLKQYDKAREALEYVIKAYPPDNPAVIMAQQRLKETQVSAAPPKR